MPSRDAFLFLQGITTEDNPIETTLFQFDDGSTPGAAAVRRTNSFNITKQSDEFTQILFQKSLDGTSILFGLATVPFRGSETGQAEHRFGNLTVNSIAFRGAPGADTTTEIVGFTFDSISTEITTDP